MPFTVHLVFYKQSGFSVTYRLVLCALSLSAVQHVPYPQSSARITYQSLCSCLCSSCCQDCQDLWLATMYIMRKHTLQLFTISIVLPLSCTCSLTTNDKFFQNQFRVLYFFSSDIGVPLNTELKSGQVVTFVLLKLHIQHQLQNYNQSIAFIFTLRISFTLPASIINWQRNSTYLVNF